MNEATKIHNNLKTKVKFISAILIIIISLCGIFPIGLLRSSTVVENTSEYIADVAKNHTNNGRYVAMRIEPNESSSGKINNSYIEFNRLYGIFREGLATYVGTVNAEKNHSIKLLELDEDVNFSFLNVDSGFGVKEYYRDSSTGEMIYKQEYYPLELMFFSDHRMVPGAYSFFYISQTRANSLLEKRGLPHETRSDYAKLLNTLTVVEINGIEYNFMIDNIYLERHYFYNSLHEVMGEFFLGGYNYPSEIKRQGLFFLREYPYQNKYFIEYATNLYSPNEFDYKILDFNFKDSFKIDESKLIYISNQSYNNLSVVLLIVIIILLIVSNLLLLLGNDKKSIWKHIVVGAALMLPYLIFWIIHISTKSVLLFSNFSTVSYIWCILGFFVIYSIIYLIKSVKGHYIG